jgi:signal transduction histidine kinase
MRRGPGLFYQVFASILAVALTSVMITGMLARWAVSVSFERYLRGEHGMGRGASGMGRMMLGGAEQAFLANVDRSISYAAIGAVILAAIAAWLLARYLTRPLHRVAAAARELAGGDLSHRVEVSGAAEVADLSDAFNEMADSLAEAERLRRRLVADVAHELRNPIAAVRAQLEGVREGVLTIDESRMASIEEDVARLSRLVDDLQELSVAEAGAMRYELSPVDLAKLTAEEVERAESLAHPGVGVSLLVASPLVPITADAFRIAQVVRNLLSNAVRHTFRGSVQVVLESAGEGIRLTVRDTGEGIGAGDLPYIWERFYRADAARSAESGGAGVGLAIARRIIEDHGGRVFAESTPGAGSAIGFELPGTEEE